LSGASAGASTLTPAVPEPGERPAARPLPAAPSPGALRLALDSLLLVATGLAAATPVIRSAITAVRDGWVPAGDDGIITTRGWDVLTAHSPLVGQYSEAGLVIRGQVMHSPGPMLYWLLALPARFGSVASIAVTMAAVNTLAIVACVALARRRGGIPLMLAAAFAIALMCQSLPAEAMHDVWNPAAALFPFLLLVFVCWSLACGDLWLAPAAVLLGSYVVQTHLMYLAPTVVLFAVAAVGAAAVWRARRRRARAAGSRPPRAWPWAATAVVLAALCWLPPAIDEIRNDPGNLTMIVRTAEHRGPTLGDSVGWHAVVRSLGVRPWWLYVPASEWERKADVRASPGSLATDSTIAILCALLATGLVAIRLRRWDLAAAAAIGLGMSAAIGLQAAENPAARLLSETLGYTMWWGSVLGMWVWLVLAWALWLALAALLRGRLRLSPAAPRRWRWSAAALAGAIGVLAVGLAVAATEKPDSHVYEYRPITRLAGAIERVVPPGQTIAYHLGALDLGTQPMETAIRFLLVRHGDRVLADGSYPRLGSYYVQGDRPYQWTVYLTDSRRPQRGMRLVGRVGFRSPWGPETLSAWAHRV
jgi:hypothetical protein